MNKLTAMRILSNAYQYLTLSAHSSLSDHDALDILERKFHNIRRSLQDIRDLRPKKDTEGLNGKMPKFF
jgi:hypothetical protein